VIEKIANSLCYKFKFGYHGVEDMKQQATLFALQGLENYDESRPLESFLWTHVRNRLHNFKRDNYHRTDKPCLGCPSYNTGCRSECSEFEDKANCELFHAWATRNANKMNLMSPVNLADMQNEENEVMAHDDDLNEFISQREFMQLIDENIPMEFRKDYLRLKNGIKLPKARRLALIDAIKTVLEETKEDG